MEHQFQFHLTALKRLVDMNCEDPRYSQIFYEQPELKFRTIYNALGDLVFKHDFNADASTSPIEIEKRRDEILEFMNKRYQYVIGTGNPLKRMSFVPWECHDVHFHPEFHQYIKCPMTCMAELSEMLEKIMKGMENT